AVDLVAVVGEVDVAEDAVLLGRETALRPLETRATGREPFFAEPGTGPAGALARLRPLLLARAGERNDQHHGQHHPPRPRASHAHPFRCRPAPARVNRGAAT